jgi:8-oxo-dGTP diphosphatase
MTIMPTDETPGCTNRSPCLDPTRWLPVRFCPALQQDQAFPNSPTFQMSASTTVKPYRLTVKAVILDGQRRCLLVRRSAFNRSFVGCWEWPGGKVDDGEDFATALLREAREETGLEVQITGLAGAAMYEMPAMHMVLLCMEASILSGELRLSEEHDDLVWAPLVEFQKFTFSPGVDVFMLDYAKQKLATP